MQSPRKKTVDVNLNAWSHDLRTATFVILGYADQLANSSRATEELANGIQSNARYLLNLIDLMNGDSPIPNQEAAEPLEHLITTVADGLQLHASHLGLSLVTELEAELPCIESDRAIRLKRILMNLLSNAVKYSDRGTITVRAGTRVSAHGSLAKSNHVYLEVQDQGRGMSPSQIESVVTLERHVAENGFPPARRSQIGLWVTKNLVRSLAGSFHISSRVGEGTTVRVVVPLEPPTSQDEQPVPTNRPEKRRRLEPCDIKRRAGRILLIDDDVDVQRLLRFALESAGLKVKVLSRGWQALSEDWQQYDAILLDLNLPGMDGFATAAQLKQTGCEVPILALTAQRPSSQNRLADLKAGGFDDWIDKLEGGAEIVHRLQKHLT